MTRGMHNIKDNLCMMLEEYGREKQLKPGDVEMVHLITDTIKNILKIDMLEEANEEYGRTSHRGRGYSDDDYSERRGSSYDGGSSRNSYSDSYDDGMSRHGSKDHLRKQIEEMMKYADTNRQRDALRNCMRQLDNE